MGHAIANKCIDCHMPVEETNVIVSQTAGQVVHAKMRNHWIKVYADISLNGRAGGSSSPLNAMGRRFAKISGGWGFNRVDDFLKRCMTLLRQRSRDLELCVRLFTFADRLIDLGNLNMRFRGAGIGLFCDIKFSNRIFSAAFTRIDKALDQDAPLICRIGDSELFQLR